MYSKIVLVHAGLGKTGTSSLQCAFVNYRNDLNKAGFVYPFIDDKAEEELAESFKMSSGNGRSLRCWMFPRYISKTPWYNEAVFLHDFNQLLADTRSNILISNESLWNCELEQWLNLKKIVNAHGYELKIVCYIRDILDYFYSSWAQQIKMGTRLDSFENVISEVDSSHFKNLLNILQCQQLNTELRYYYQGIDLFNDFFLNEFGISLDAKAPRPIINRSLNASEILEVVNLNKSVAENQIATKEAKKRVDSMLNSQPAEKKRL